MGCPGVQGSRLVHMVGLGPWFLTHGQASIHFTGSYEDVSFIPFPTSLQLSPEDEGAARTLQSNLSASFQKAASQLLQS